MVRSVAGCTAVLVLAAALLLAGPAGAATYTPQECITCHTTSTPGIVTQYQDGAMSKKGVTCVSCHGADHSRIFADQGKVPAGTCAKAGCHPDQYAEFAHKDAAGGYTNKHAIGWTRMTAAARYKVMPEAERYEMCERCHNIGYVSADGSVGKCDSCHTRHTFSAQEAMEPEACGTCHMGPDHEQIDMWTKSKHGVVYTTEKNRVSGNPDRAPTCVTCHMPAQEKPAGQPLVHDVSTNITLGTVAQGARLPGVALPVPMRTITNDEFTAKRAKMSAICGQCHAASFVKKNLEGADQIKTDVDTLLWDPVMRIRGLWYDGLLDPMPVNRAPNPLFGLNLVLGGQQLYGGTSAIEQLFFYTYKYDHVNTFKGAYHINPDYSHWFGWARRQRGSRPHRRRGGQAPPSRDALRRRLHGPRPRGRQEDPLRRLAAARLGQRVAQYVLVVVRRRVERRHGDGHGRRGQGCPRVRRAGDVQGATDLRRLGLRERQRPATAVLGAAHDDADGQGHEEVVRRWEQVAGRWPGRPSRGPGLVLRRVYARAGRRRSASFE